MAAKKGQLQFIDAAPPIEMGPGTDAQQGLATGGQGAAPEFQHAPQMGVVPAADQQHRLAQ